jgi:NAD(P)-dependent dehydrogenase (short-subunit alcohol dehydrogenase family)
MAEPGSVVIIGGTSVFGERLAQHYCAQGRKVYVTSRDQARANEIASNVGSDCTGLALDLAQPHQIADALADIGTVDRLILLAIQRDANSVRDFNIDSASTFILIKLVGYLEVIHALVPRMPDSASIVLYGGNARDWPYPGSTSVTTANGGITHMVNTLGVELAPIRVNAIHPSVVGDSPFWASKPDLLDIHRSRTTTGRLVTVDDVVEATVFLLEQQSITGVNLNIDAGTNLR